MKCRGFLRGKTAGEETAGAPCATRPRSNRAQLVQRWIVAALRRHWFYSVDQANQAIGPLLVRLNARPFRKRDGSRASVFQETDRPALRSLPAERFDISQWSHARVNIDYNVGFDSNFYSVAYNLVHELIEVRSLPTTVEISIKACAWHRTFDLMAVGRR